jgi:hypothetical protein
MSPLCQLEMTLPGGFAGGVKGDGSADERRGAGAARSAAGSGSKAIDDRGGGAVAGARAPSGLPAVAGIPDRGSGGPDLEATRSPQQAAGANIGDDPRRTAASRARAAQRAGVISATLVSSGSAESSTSRAS